MRRLAQLGAEPLFEHKVTGVNAVPGGYEVVGDGFAVRAPYLVGADGLGSTVRSELGITLPIDTYDEAFLLGDVIINDAFHPEESHVFPSRHGLLFFCPTAATTATCPIGSYWRRPAPCGENRQPEHRY